MNKVAQLIEKSMLPASFEDRLKDMADLVECFWYIGLIVSQSVLNTGKRSGVGQDNLMDELLQIHVG